MKWLKKWKISNTNNYQKLWSSGTEVKQTLKINSSNIPACCKGKKQPEELGKIISNNKERSEKIRKSNKGKQEPLS